MLNVGTLNQDQSNAIFLNSNAVELQPVVSAEWNQNLFNQPYLTTSGIGIKETISLSDGTVTQATGALARDNFTTNVFSLSSGSGSISYSCETENHNPAYKIVTYVKTDSIIPVIINSYAKGVGTLNNNISGSSSFDANSFDWVKVTTYVGSSAVSNGITDLTYTLSINANGSDPRATDPDNQIKVYYTVPEIYETTYFDYQYNSLWPTESPFTYFRPGESYVPSGNIKYSYPDNYRKVNSVIVSGQSNNTFAPITPVIQNPSFSLVSVPEPFFKNVLPTDISPYKYFVSDIGAGYISNITALYEQNISSNKIVIKFNTIMAIPTINLFIDGSEITVDGSNNIIPDSKGLIVLYWSGTAWTKTKWTNAPKFGNDGTLSIYTSFKKITVRQIDTTVNSSYSDLPRRSSDVAGGITRMQVVEVSPRLEVDLTNFVKEVQINKSLDSKNNFVPISSINTDDAAITLSAIPVIKNNIPLPLFSSQSNKSSNVLTNMLRKNIKFYLSFWIKSNYTNGSYTTVDKYVPGGVFYSDTWDETDIKDVKIQCYDITRYLQTTPVPDYVANLKPVFDVVTNVLDLAGFTDYDYDSLYRICNSATMPLDLAYYYCNSKDTTIIDALAQIFLAYQIGAYIDEYGVMKFLSLEDILANRIPKITFTDSQVIEGGYAISNKAKPGKISLRYESPKIKQGKAVQNISYPLIAKSPSFVYTTANDPVWIQTNMDGVGFNYLSKTDYAGNTFTMGEKDSKFLLNRSDLLDVFHTFNLNNNGYAFIEDEIVSFVYKEYKISNLSGTSSTVVSVKNDIELGAEINRFIKKYAVGLVTTDGQSKGDFDVKVELTGYITNVQRGLFGTLAKPHTIMGSLSDKGLVEKVCNSSYQISDPLSSNTSIYNTSSDFPNLPSVTKIQVGIPASEKVLIYNSSQGDIGYGTYSVKFDLSDASTSSSGLFFNFSNSSNANGTYFLELVKFDTSSTSTPSYKYLLILYQINSSGQEVILGWSEITGLVKNLINNFQKVLVNISGTKTYTTASDQAFNLKLVHYQNPNPLYPDDATGEDTGELVSIFLNNIEVNNWNVSTDAQPTENASGWIAKELNQITRKRKKLFLPATVTQDSVFGYFTSTKPIQIKQGVTQYNGSSLETTYTNKYSYKTISAPSIGGSLREIYATQKPLIEKSTNYWFQDREFLNAIVQNQNIFNNSLSYIMQTTPEIYGINVYDVQYTGSAATIVDHFWKGYLMIYSPNDQISDKQFYQKQIVRDDALSFSTPLNTGFRAKMAITNNANQMVFLMKTADSQTQVTSIFDLVTHEAIVPSDPEIIEKITDPANISEVAQLDSPWIQSKEAANKMLNVMTQGFEGFSKDITLTIFGNPLIQVGDVVQLVYSLAGINQKSYIVHSVSQSFNQGLKTVLVLNMLGKGSSIA